MKKSGKIRDHFNILAEKMKYFVRYELDKTTKVCLRLILQVAHLNFRTNLQASKLFELSGGMFCHFLQSVW
jgi:hypothetical protein